MRSEHPHTIDFSSVPDHPTEIYTAQPDFDSAIVGLAFRGAMVSVDFSGVLSNRIAQVFMLSAIGGKDWQVADQLDLDKSTIKTGRGIIFRTLGVHCMQSAVRTAFNNQFMVVEEPHKTESYIGSILPSHAELLVGLAHGMSNEEIARKFTSTHSINTVKSRAAVMRDKAGVPNQPSLVLYGYTSGLLRPQVKRPGTASPLPATGRRTNRPSLRP
jgi:DNA-binding NarL/FixJ family response regulator